MYKIGDLGGNQQNEFYSLYEFYKNSTASEKKGSNRITNFEQFLKRELYENGPVMLCFSVFDGFLHYLNGRQMYN